MLHDSFRRVTEAVAQAPETIAREEGVRHHKHGESFTLRSEWNAGFLCILGCGDKSGSASFTRELFFRCHQCAAKADVFDWLAQVRGTDPWTECKRLADRFNITLKTKTLPKSRALPPRMSEDLVASCTHALLESDQAGHARSFLKERKLWQPRLLAELGIGWLRGYITFPQRNAAGELYDRYRGYSPGSKPPWRWLGKGSGGPRVWPEERLPSSGDKILLLEGEWDVLTALIRLRLHEQGWTPCTFTSGAGAMPKTHDLPRWMHGREVHIAYDNDTFQGPDYANYKIQTKGAQDFNKAQHALDSRLTNLLERICPTLQKLGGKAWVKACPIDPLETWGADLRDWVEGGGRDLNDWPTWEFDALPELHPEYEEVGFDEVFGKIGRRVKTVVQLASVQEGSVAIPELSDIDCARGGAPACNTCPAMAYAPEWIVDWADHPRHLAQSLISGDPDYLIKHVLTPARGCPKAEFVHKDAASGCVWGAQRPESNTADSKSEVLSMISREKPSMTGEMEVVGTVHSLPKGGFYMRVDDLKALDEQTVDLDPFLGDLLLECPWRARTPDEIDDYLEKRWQDHTSHVTKIKGQREVYITHELLMHSTLTMTRGGVEEKGTVDACIFGDTTTGKSATINRLFDFHRLGVMHASAENTSRAGLVGGTDRKQRFMPGLFPRCHKKALVLDEVHKLVKGVDKHWADWVQDCRRVGQASSVKVSGSIKVPARARFLAISNWTRESKSAFGHICEHLRNLYGSPEAIGRIDFALAVEADKSSLREELPKVPQFWTVERTRALILRAWSQTVEMVHVDDEVHDLIDEQCYSWNDRFGFNERVPLFNVHGTGNSLLRVAIAIANVCFSHVEGKPLHVHVRKVHAEWAIEWIKLTWERNDFASYAEKSKSLQAIHSPLDAEKHLTARLSLSDYGVAINVLSNLSSTFNVEEFCVIAGMERHEATKWLARAQQLHIFERQRGSNGWHFEVNPTRGGAALIRSIISVADEDPQEYKDRYDRLSRWDIGSTAEIPPLETRYGSDEEALPF